ncbi:ATP-binding protein [Paraconexibacter antarcticus]|uniref:ATP-binding protein n=1 Tax=Paraconexibacter antarcticus TaxID=2949664 RepID=A0ABY5DW60_9ACTN|nr:ATP-binding protein [Paraconexibacter antarcticus]UTI65326.1 ATP-binding protein [Paraconexibacter antarcticus]
MTDDGRHPTPPPGRPSPHFREDFPAHPNSIGTIRGRCRRVAAQLGASDDRQEEIALAVTEAATNVVLYAYPGTLRGLIHLRTASPAVRTLEITIADTGVGLGRTPVPGGLGQGLLIIEQVTDSLVVGPNTPSGTTVRMRFELP